MLMKSWSYSRSVLFRSFAIAGSGGDGTWMMVGSRIGNVVEEKRLRVWKYKVKEEVRPTNKVIHSRSCGGGRKCNACD